MSKPTPQVSLTEKPALSVNECAALLGLSRGSVYKLLNSGELKSVVIAGRRMFARSAIDSLIANAGGHARGADAA
jgi:excisionase family DNA binding protein